jgi:hypothetical protein
MAAELESIKAKISVFTRHSADCEHRDDPQYRKCKCRKSLYIYERGKVRYKTAATRSWEKAETLAVEERALRDPTEIQRRKLVALEAEQKEAVKAAEAAADAAAITVEAALDLWIGGKKNQSDSTAKTYRIVRGKISHWAAEQKITQLREVTPSALDIWRSEWSPESAAMKPEVEAANAARVGAMGHHERFNQAASMIDIPEPSEADEVEFAKLILGPQATTQDLIAMLVRTDPPPKRA